VSLDELDLEIQGSALILAGRRSLPSAEGDVYQQVEIGRGEFRRTIELGRDVVADQAKARYDEGMLRIEVPLAPAPQRPRVVPIESASEES
jgi:HSP20 family protein